jgi:two-component system, cell cycle response regulator CtrA
VSYLAELEQKHMTAMATITAQAQRIEELEAALQKALHVPTIPPQLRLTRLEGKFFEALLSRSELSKEALFEAVYADRYLDNDEPEIKIVDVLVCKLRKKLAPFKLTIETLWGRGYALSVESKAAIRRMNKRMLHSSMERAA